MKGQKMKVILKIKLCVMLSLLLIMTQTSFNTAYSGIFPERTEIQILFDEKEFDNILKDFNEAIRLDPDSEKTIRK
ncbi:MAG: hypothetical protein LBE18_01440, partial [Planctomycetaceae bacterium]|nr:hypothetical protein [Planctomycetaceae bacterium]